MCEQPHDAEWMNNVYRIREQTGVPLAPRPGQRARRPANSGRAAAGLVGRLLGRKTRVEGLKRSHHLVNSPRANECGRRFPPERGHTSLQPFRACIRVLESGGHRVRQYVRNRQIIAHAISLVAWPRYGPLREPYRGPRFRGRVSGHSHMSVISGNRAGTNDRQDKFLIPGGTIITRPDEERCLTMLREKAWKTT